MPRYPEKSRAGSGALTLEETDADEERRVEAADRKAKFGAFLLAVGFLLQLVALVCGT